MFFSPTGVNFDYSVLIKSNNKSLAQTDRVKFLGLVMDKNLSWRDHIEDLCKKLAVKNFLTTQLKSTVTTETLKVFYFGCINSVLSYGIVCWGGSSYLQKVFVWQKRIIRNMFNMQYNASCRSIFGQHGILTIYSIYILECVCFVKNNMDKFVTCGKISKYSTRATKNIYIRSYRLEQTSKSPFVMALRLYNCLPSTITVLENTALFKKKVKGLLLDNAIYSIKEYFDLCIE